MGEDAWDAFPAQDRPASAALAGLQSPPLIDFTDTEPPAAAQGEPCLPYATFYRFEHASSTRSFLPYLALRMLLVCQTVADAMVLSYACNQMLERCWM